tara:strand:- start:3494 stop:3772 length:279 start_codon:yes stop_codon:yes gene_type:complete
MDYFEPQNPAYIKKERAKARELRKSQWWKQKLATGICYYCEQRFDKEDLNMDHLIPLVRGGKTSKSNCVLSCKACNFKKKHKTPVDLILEEL